MQFNSIPFIFYFFPLFLAVYYLIPRKGRSAVLVLGSLLFYWMSGSQKLWPLGLLVAMMVLTYLLGLEIEKGRSGLLLGLSMTFMAGLLIFFKLYQGGKFLPAGLSFYLFQMAAYLIDVYRRRLPAERNLLAYGAQSVMFPKLLSGPLVEPQKLQANNHNIGFADHIFHRGLQELILGLGLKVLLADRVGGLWAQAGVIGYESISTPFAWLSLLSYTLRLYFDFYGYSLMAVGIGRMLGYYLPMNFLQPYSAKSVSDFYRRWHASLGAWFREYIYIPLGGNRKGNFRTALNLIAVWAFTGFWHGVGGNYLVWALFLCVLILNERFWLRKLLDKTYVLGHVYTVFMILLSWVPFAIGDWNQMAIFLGKLFGVCAKALNPNDYVIWLKDYGVLLSIGVLFATPLPQKLWDKFRENAFADVLLFVLFWVVVYFAATSASDPFMYFQY